ncbi:MAG: hypothetical protein KGS60_08100 [Verrucomicrobia bacterium]|nr:hypothetical protein [Verrucomicrobiota bacterium]
MFKSVGELEQAIRDYISDPAPFIWTAKPTDLLEKVKRGRAAWKNKFPSVHDQFRYE